MPCGDSRALCRIISGLHFCMGGFGEGWQCLCLLVELNKRSSRAAAADDTMFHLSEDRVVRALLSRSALDTLGIM